ncbi:hypothetical protein TPENAI_30037 [Tenacibaculum litopenaei]|uniref:hypothetical protein n=1 Tax=Tenacibaculum litopenaei TaxID=396016 RepID=UPI003895D9F5
MIDIWRGRDFETLYKQFRAKSAKGKIFMMRDYQSGDTTIGKGAIILLHRTSLFILGLLTELYLKDSRYMIGDIGLLFCLAQERNKELSKKLEQLRAKNIDRARLRKMQLRHILKRKQKSIKSLKPHTNTHKKQK